VSTYTSGIKKPGLREEPRLYSLMESD